MSEEQGKEREALHRNSSGETKRTCRSSTSLFPRK